MQEACHDEMRQAFLSKFEEWWPFAREQLMSGGWVQFSICLEVKGRGDYFVRGSLGDSDKVKVYEAKAGGRTA